MQKSNKKIFDNLVSRTKIYLVIILILLGVICLLHHSFIVPSIIIYIAIMTYTYLGNNKRKSEISETLQDLTLTVDTAAKTSLINSPFPLIILETDGNVVWKSEPFATEFEDTDMDTLIDDLVIELKEEIKNKKDKNDKAISKKVKVNNRIYKLIGKFVKSKRINKNEKEEYMAVLYFIDETENIKLKKEYNDSKSCIGIITIDNYEENMQMLESEEKVQYIAEIDKYIYEWTNETNGIIIKPERDKYVYIFEQRYIEKIKEDKFSILDKIKELDPKQKVQFTLSIAISNEGETDKEKYKSAQTAMDIVLGRGGDQAVIRQDDIYKFFGGRTQEVEKRTKVKARVVAQALENMIKESSKVMIMGHSNPDIDAMGSSIGIYRLAKSLEKNAYIITSETPTLKSFKESLIKEEPEYEDILINKEVAEENIDADTLLVVVDTHKRTYVESEEALKKAQNIVIIDHHRRSADFIENSTLTFQEVYASSAAELVTELLQYAQVEVELKKIEAESLYAGIMVDTKSFTFKTGVRTFEAAAYLRKCGVDIIKVKKWFQSDLESFNKIAEIVKNAEIVNNSIAIALCSETNSKDVGLLCAKAADELLTISDVTASFVLGNIGDKINISGRSIGDINVQIILEKLGGGGHITLAGAQVEGKTIEEVKQELVIKINEYFSEIEN